MKEVYELDVYRLAEDLSDLIWSAYDAWDYKAQHTLGVQVIRASDSIAANIAEGYGRFSPADRKKFFLYASGSFEETKKIDIQDAEEEYPSQAAEFLAEGKTK